MHKKYVEILLQGFHRLRLTTQKYFDNIRMHGRCRRQMFSRQAQDAKENNIMKQDFNIFEYTLVLISLAELIIIITRC